MENKTENKNFKLDENNAYLCISFNAETGKVTQAVNLKGTQNTLKMLNALNQIEAQLINKAEDQTGMICGSIRNSKQPEDEYDDNPVMDVLKQVVNKVYYGED